MVKTAPVSFGQQRLWYLHRYGSSGAAYNEPTGLLLTGPLNVSALERSLNVIVARHESLRTRFRRASGQGLQVIDPELTLTLPLVDLRGVGRSRREAEARRLAAEEAEAAFNLEKGPVLRAKLLRLEDRRHILLVTVHHIAFDGRSQEILCQELGTLYEAFVTGKPPSLPDLPWQYADFAFWQRDRLRGKLIDGQLAYWEKQLCGVPSPAKLPGGRPRPAMESFVGSSQSAVFPRQLLDALKALGRQERVTLYMVLLAAFKTLLHRFTGETDVVVGTPVSSRNRVELTDVIGFFVNTLVLRTNLDGNPTFRELLGRIRRVSLAGYARQEVPFDRVVSHLGLPRSRSHAPLVQVMFQLRLFPKPMEVSDLKLTEYRVDTRFASSELAFELAEIPEGLFCRVQYRSDLFDAEAVGRLLSHYRVLLESIVGDPSRRLSELRLLSDRQRHRLVSEWARPPREASRAATVLERLDAQVDERPNAVAVECEDRSLTYHELDEQANQLARHLRRLGVRRESRVAVCDERSMDLVVGLLGVLKAGGVYVPLDPQLPEERLAFLLDDVQPDAVVTRRRLLPAAWKRHARLVCFDADRAQIRDEHQTSLPTIVEPDDLAYVIYTSGSSGTPKGVMISHRALGSHCVGMIRHYELGADDRVLQFASTSFDPSIEQILTTLMAGGALVLRPNVVWSADELWHEILRQRLTVVNLPPGVFRPWIEAAAARGDPDRFGELRLVIVGGDVLPPASVAIWRNTAPASVRLLNAYGPTEATITSTLFDVSRYDERIHPDGVPIGRPAGNSLVYVLDENLEPVPIGVRGEIYLGGEGVARGYWRRPELTAEKFTRDPFGVDSGARLYKTGDFARWLPDGYLDFLGRSDGQVKVRGFRIELQEIEAALSRHPDVKEAVVGVETAGGGEKRLVAYLVFRGRDGQAPGSVRRFLQKRLPAYMVPSAFVTLDALPLTSNGKVDRNALSPVGSDRPETERGYVAPRNAVERRLAAIWRELLDVEHVGVADDFFELGGDSLLAVQLAIRITSAFGMDFRLSTLLDASTVEQLAAILGSRQPIRDRGSLVPLQPDGSKPPFFCVHAVGGHALRYRKLAQLLGPDQPFYAIEAQGVDGKQLPQTRVEEMAAQYLREIVELVPEGPYYLGGYCSGGIIAYEMAQQLVGAGRRVGHLVFIDTCHPRLWERPAFGTRVFRAIKRFARTLIHLGFRLLGRSTPRCISDRLVNEVMRRALTGYVPRPYAGRVTLIRSTTHPCDGHPLMGWADLVEGGIDVRTVPGEHAVILSDHHVEHAAGGLRAVLDQSYVAARESDRRFSSANLAVFDSTESTHEREARVDRCNPARQTSRRAA